MKTITQGLGMGALLLLALVLHACSRERKGTRGVDGFDWSYFGWEIAIGVGVILFLLRDQWPRKEPPPSESDRSPQSDQSDDSTP